MTTPGQKEVLTLFGQHLPSLSTQTPTEEAGDAKSKEDGRPRKWRQSALPCDQGQPRLEQQLGQLGRRSPGNLLALVTCLSLRQEDDLAATRADNAFLFYLETGTTGTYRPIPSFAGHFFAIAQQWQKLRDETPEKLKLSLSLRTTLLLAYVTEFHERLRHA